MLEKLLEALANERDPHNKTESIAKIITNLLKKRPDIRSKVKEHLPKSGSQLIPMGYFFLYPLETSIQKMHYLF